ncbi:hypothetical protein, partial [Dasania marina]|uniref:hypothetical protein n=1 Tax=Dasania marina TaxID=471499 RepID=UPI0030D827CC
LFNLLLRTCLNQRAAHYRDLIRHGKCFLNLISKAICLQKKPLTLRFSCTLVGCSQPESGAL